MDLIVQACGYFNINNFSIIEKINKAEPKLDKDDLLEKRKKFIGNKCQTFYAEDPFIVTKASMQYLYDEENRKYIDCISNVQHVGHCHPSVVESISTQLATSTCNVRFVSSKLTECAEEILKTLPGFDTLLFCNSGSEANDLALRLARDFTKQKDVIILDHAYHGHLTTTMQMSPYKFDHGCSIKKPEWVHVAPVPDVYRGTYRLSDEYLKNDEKLLEAGTKYAAEVEKLILNAEKNNRKIGAFIAEALQSCGGQIIYPKNYLQTIADRIHEHGGLVIIDEVQTGFGRVGQTFWAHQIDNVVPDILTMGKPIGNGYPVAVVATRKEIADCLGGDVGYFNTYGGNPVACAAVLGVLNVIKKENLLDHCKKMSIMFEQELMILKEKHHCIGDIRGVGMFWGIDLVSNRETREPATQLAKNVIMKLRQEYGVLLNADGPNNNILKFKPPLCFNESDLKEVMGSLDLVLAHLTII